MKKLRYLYLGASLIIAIGTALPSASVFADEKLLVSGGQDISAVDEDVADKSVMDESITDGIIVDGAGSEEVMPRVLISSFNPGFSDPYIGEFFEIKKLSESSILLAGLSVMYETSTGSEYIVYEFPDGDEMIGESLLFRLASSDEVKQAEETGAKISDFTYTRNMSQSAGRLKLRFGEEVVDSLCWGLKEVDCYKAFNSKKPTTLVREKNEEEIGEFVHTEGYAPMFDALRESIKHKEVIEEIVEPQCRGLEFNEILAYFETANKEQFIELANRSEETIKLDGCFLNYKAKNYALSGEILAGEVSALYPAELWGLVMTKNPVSSNKLMLIDVDGETVDTASYYSGQKKGVSLALVGSASDGSRSWVQTYSPTPGAENRYQQFKTCPVGKVINLETGNCVNEAPAVSELAACPVGKYRNPLTGRCKSIETASTELKPCAEGYERNPETNRCRKIVANTGADYPVTPATVGEKKEFVSVWAIATIVVAGLGYIAFQYKEELAMVFGRKQVG